MCGTTWLPAATASLLGAEALVVLLHHYLDSVRDNSGSGEEDPTSLSPRLASNTWLSGGGPFCLGICLCLRPADSFPTVVRLELVHRPGLGFDYIQDQTPSEVPTFRRGNITGWNRHLTPGFPSAHAPVYSSPGYPWLAFRLGASHGS